MMPAATVSLVVPSITSNVYAMYIISIYLFIYIVLFIIITIIINPFHCLLICRYYRMVLYIYIAVMSVLARDKFLNFIVATIYLILCYVISGSVAGGIAIDFVSRLVYYTDGASDTISVMTLDGSQHFTLLTVNMDEPRDIALDIARGYVQTMINL